MSYTRTRSMTTSLLGPKVFELRNFLEGVPTNAKVSVHLEKVDIHDPGYITFTVDEGPNERPIVPIPNTPRKNDDLYIGPYGYGVGFPEGY